jgi:hypothetical protein
MPKITFHYDDGTVTEIHMETNLHVAAREAEIRYGGIAKASERIGLDRNVIPKALSGAKPASDRTFLKLANLLKIPVAAIAGVDSDLAILIKARTERQNAQVTQK